MVRYLCQRLFTVPVLILSLCFLHAFGLQNASSIVIIEQRIDHYYHDLIVSRLFRNEGRVANSKTLHQITLAIKQRNIDYLKHRLLDTHYPGHYTVAEMDEFVKDEQAVETVTDYLVNTHNLSRASLHVSRNGAFITLLEPISLLEQIFHTEIFSYTTLSGGKPVFRAESASLPATVATHVIGVLDLVHFPITALYRAEQQPAADSTERVLATTSKSPVPSPASFARTDPYKLKTTYNIGAAIGSSSNTQGQAVYGAMGQAFSPRDLASFLASQSLLSSTPIGIQANLTTDYHTCAPTAFTASKSSSTAACTHATAEMEYISSIASNTPTTYWYSSQTSLSSVGDVMTEWLLNVTMSSALPNVITLGGWYLGYEFTVSRSLEVVFNNEAVKLGNLGTTIVVAAGDDGAAGIGPIRDGLDYCGYFPLFPATSSWVTAVGATMGGMAGSSISTEIVCSTGTGGGITSGGGFSIKEPAPVYQQAHIKAYFAALAATGTVPRNLPPGSVGTSGLRMGYNQTFRGYPDLSMSGDSYSILLGGREAVVSGSSLAAAVVAGIVSLVNSGRILAGRPTVGFMNSVLYSAPLNFAATQESVSPILFARDVTYGDNKCTSDSKVCCANVGFPAASGWDPVSGLGSADYGELLLLMMLVGDHEHDATVDRYDGTNTVILPYAAYTQYHVPYLTGLQSVVVEVFAASGGNGFGSYLSGTVPVVPGNSIAVQTGRAGIGPGAGGMTRVDAPSPSDASATSAVLVAVPGGGSSEHPVMNPPFTKLQSILEMQDAAGDGQVRISYTTASWYVGQMGESCLSVCRKKPHLECVDEVKIWPLTLGQMQAVLHSVNTLSSPITCQIAPGTVSKVSYPEFDGVTCTIGMGGGTCDGTDDNVKNQRICPCVSTLTPRPSTLPTPAPTPPPHTRPTPGPTPLPGHPTATPTPPPTFRATPKFTAPTFSPSPDPSPHPSPMPTAQPTAQPTLITASMVSFTMTKVDPAAFTASTELVSAMQLALVGVLNVSFSQVALPTASSVDAAATIGTYPTFLSRRSLAASSPTPTLSTPPIGNVLIQSIITHINPLARDSPGVVGAADADITAKLLKQRLPLLLAAFKRNCLGFSSSNVASYRAVIGAEINPSSVIVANLAPSFAPSPSPTAASSLGGLLGLESAATTHSIAVIIGASLGGTILLLLAGIIWWYRKSCCACTCSSCSSKFDTSTTATASRGNETLDPSSRGCCRRRKPRAPLSASSIEMRHSISQKVLNAAKVSIESSGPSRGGAKNREGDRMHTGLAGLALSGKKAERAKAADDDEEEEEEEDQDEDEDSDIENGDAKEFDMHDVYAASPTLNPLLHPNHTPAKSMSHVTPAEFNRRALHSAGENGRQIVSNPIAMFAETKRISASGSTSAGASGLTPRARSIAPPANKQDAKSAGTSSAAGSGRRMSTASTTEILQTARGHAPTPPKQLSKISPPSSAPKGK